MDRVINCNYKDSLTKNKLENNPVKKRLLQSICHYSCQECDGSTEEDCLTCSTGIGRYYNSIKRMCLCEINLFDIGVEECQIFEEAVPTGQLIQENLIYQGQCKFGQFKVLLENNRFFCLDCPKSGNDNLNCLDCYFNPETWYKAPRCTLDFVKLKNDENYGYLMQLRNEIDFETFIITESFQLMSTPYYQQICSDNEVNQDGSDCKLMNQMHLEKQLYAICKDYTYYDQNQCIQCPLFCSKCEIDQCQNCISHTYLQNGQCYECPKECRECQYNIDTDSVECYQCYENFGLSQGKCIECGLHCVYCMFWSFYDDYYGIQIEYLRCMQCSDNSKYFVSSNGIDCQENLLNNCLYAFQTDDLIYFSQTTYQYQLKKFQNPITGCARCQNDFDVDDSGQCVPSENLIESCFLVYRYGNQETYCLISDYTWSQQKNKCFDIISNCEECILEQWTNKLLCILCQPGYYAHRLFGYCIECPQELNCIVCYQQQTLFQDGWIYNIRSYYEAVMNAVYVQTENSVPKTFRTAGQSQNIEDYEISCKICQDGFQLYNNICILNCPEGCLECKIENNQNICLKCYNDENGRIQSLVDNECLPCPSNCKLCTPRTNDEISNLNPYFDDYKYQNFANRCLKPSDFQTFSYDPDFEYFINCENKQSLCQNVLTISLQLYCDQEEYDNDLNLASDTQLKKLQFLKTTVFLDDLLNNSFQYLENDQFYSLLNKKQIRKLTIKILIKQQQNCYFQNKAQIDQLFRSHVFSLSSVNLEFVGTQSNKFYIFDSLEFHNFQSISFEAITFYFQTSSFINEQTIKFLSIQKQDIQFKNLIIMQENEKTQNINIQFSNINLINILDVQIQSVNINSTYGLFQFIQPDDVDISGIIKFSNLNISSTNLINSYIVNYQILNPFVIYFENISLNLNLTNSQFFTSNIINNFGNLIIHQLEIIDSIFINSSQLIKGNFLKLIELNSIILKQNQFDQSNLIFLNKNTTVYNLKIENCVILNSYLILNHLQQKSNQDIFYLFQFKNFSLINNVYNQGAKYMTIYRYTSTISNIIIEQLKIENNTCIDNQNLHQKKQSSALIILEGDQIDFQNVEIYKLSGIPDFSIINAQNLIINNLFITTHRNKYDLFLQKQKQKISDLGTIFHIYSVKSIRFNNFFLISLFVSNNPIIYYEQATKTLINQDAYIEVVNSQFMNNLLFQDDQFNTNLFEIFSEQKVMINFLNTTFKNNIIYYLNQGTTIQSTNLINIDCFECLVQLRELNIQDNIAVNTSSSILFIKVYELSIIESNFDNNGQITKNVIDFFDHISLEYDNNIFYQGSGNGIFQSDFMFVNNSNFHNQYGSKGASLSYSPLNQGFLRIENTKIDTSLNYFSQENEKGGAIYIGPSTVNVQLELKNCEFSNIQSFQGGLLMIDSPQHNIQIQINNSIILNSFALYGSLVYVNFEELYQDSSFLQLQDIYIQNNLEGFLKFCQLFYNNQSHYLQKSELQQNLQILLFERSIIYSKLGKITMKNISISGIINEIVIQDQQIRLLQINQIVIQNSSISNQGLIYIQPSESQNFSINIDTFLVENLQIYKDETQLEFLKNYKLIRKSIMGILNIVSIHKDGQMEFRNIKFKNNICSNCLVGLMNFQFNSYSRNNLNIYEITFWQNTCGKRGCLNIIQDKIDSSITDDLDNQRLLESINQNNNNLDFVFNIQNYYCYHNLGTYGVCLFVQNIAGYIDQSIFASNDAEISGGAIYSFGNKSNLILMRTQVIENSASYGGGLSFQNHFSPNLLSYETLLFENKAKYFGNDYAEYPTHVIIKMNNYNQFYYRQKSLNTKENKIQIVTATQMKNQQELNSIMLPSAQHLNLYEQFDWKNNNYIMMNYTLRLIPYDQRNNRIKNLTNSKCFIQGRLYDLNKLEQSELKEFSNNFTNKNEVYYEDSIEEYNFDDLIIYFDPDLPDNIVLQFEFKCDSIRIPIINDNISQNTVIEQSEEYYLRLNIKTLPCQIGELKDETDLSCHPCDYTKDLYSVNFNQNRCRVRDNIQMESVKSAQIKLRPSFWRPYFYADIIENCYNYQINCLGGWTYGDSSCSQGHIGALCEQCDIYNTKGEGSYSISSKFKCGSCDDTNANTLIIIGISLWTLISISISVKSTVEIIKQLARASKLKSIGITIVVTKNNAVNLIKILTNYLQIIASISTFQLQLPQNMDSLINSLGNPIETMAYSLDCFLKDIFSNIFIHYSRTIWQLIMPIIYILLFFQLYGVGVIIKLVDFSFCVISTTLIYMFIYLQPNIIAGQIGLLSYRTISGFQWILGNVANRYDTKDHMKWLISFSFPVLLTFGVLIPGLLFNRLYTIKNNLNIMKNRLIWGYLYNEYKGSAYYWEIIKIIQKELIIIFLTFYQDQILVKAVLVYGIIFIYNYLTLQIFPYQAMQLNVLDHQSTRICGFSIVLAIGIYGSLQNGILEVQIPFYIIMTIINFLFLAKLLLFIIKAYFEQFTIVIDKLRDIVRTKIPQLQQYPFFKKLLKNQQETSLRAQKNFRKIKIAVMMISKQNIQNKKTGLQQERKGTFVLDTKITLNLIDQTPSEQNNKQLQVMLTC